MTLLLLIAAASDNERIATHIPGDYQQLHRELLLNHYIKNNMLYVIYARFEGLLANLAYLSAFGRFSHEASSVIPSYGSPPDVAIHHINKLLDTNVKFFS